MADVCVLRVGGSGSVRVIIRNRVGVGVVSLLPQVCLLTRAWPSGRVRVGVRVW